MSLPPLIGHDEVCEALGRAIARSGLPGALLLHGPPGIGKQRLALWVAQRLVCEDAGERSAPCGQCRACQLALKIEHPDIHWFFPLIRPKTSGGPERLADALEEARAAELAVRRVEPWRATGPSELAGIYLAQVQTLRKMAAVRPAMSARKVFLIGDGENMVSQEASTEAANALLKVLEEPPDNTVIIITVNDADALLPTIRSRLMPVRVRALPEDMVAELVQKVTQATPESARLAARLSQGSIGRALAFLPLNDEPGAMEVLRQRAHTLLLTALDHAAAPRLSSALNTAPAGARAEFADTLDFLALWVRDLAAVSDDAPDIVVNCDATDSLRVLANRLPGAARGAPDALRSIDLARGMTRSNINPQLTLAWLLRSVGEAIVRPN
jgi:DNA polymerase-3 subunit delta'